MRLFSILLAGVLILAALPFSVAAQTQVLPEPLYYIGQGQQLYRLETDGITVSNITTDTLPVTGFSISPVDGSLAYVVGNNLVRAAADGSNPQVLVQGPVVPLDEGGYPTIEGIVFDQIASPVWSPDGSMIYFAQAGIQRIAAAGGTPEPLITLDIERQPGADFTAYMGAKIYRPGAFSPDGTKMIAFYSMVPEAGSFEIYDVASNSIIPVQGENGTFAPCCDLTWSADSASLYITSASLAYFEPGLYRVDASSGLVETLLPGFTNGADVANMYAGGTILPDGQLYYFYTLFNMIEGGAPNFEMRRLDPATLTETTLRPSSGEVSMALWSRDGSGAVVARYNSNFTGQPDSPEMPFTLFWIPAGDAPEVALPAQLGYATNSMAWAYSE